MILCRFIFLLIFISVIIGLIEAVSKVESTDNSSSSVAPKNLLQKENNDTRSFTLPVEGGDIVVPQSNLSLLKKNDDVQLPKLPPKDLEENLSAIKNKIKMEEDKKVIQQSNLSLLKENDAVLLPKLPSEGLEESHSFSKSKGKHVVGRTGAPVSIELKDISTERPVAIQKSTLISKLTSKTSTVSISSTTKPHKPLVLKYQEGSILSGRTSTPGIIDGTSAQPNKPGSHPGMVMPVVIVILIVPLFAVLGYMALKRGQEAWKNRHYKRMDFLLDGMYND